MATRYNENFKIEVVKAYMAGDRSISEIAADYNVAKSTLTGWVKKHGEECQYKTTTKTSQEESESAKDPFKPQGGSFREIARPKPRR